KGIWVRTFLLAMDVIRVGTRATRARKERLLSCFGSPSFKISELKNFFETHIGHLRYSDRNVLRIAKLDRHGAKRLAELDDRGFCCHIGLARSKKPNTHVHARDYRVGPSEAQHSDTGCGVGQSHQQTSVERFENAAVIRIVGCCERGGSLTD